MSMVIPEKKKRQTNQPQRDSCAIFTSAPIHATRAGIEAANIKKSAIPKRTGFPMLPADVSVVGVLPMKLTPSKMLARIMTPSAIRYNVRLSDLFIKPSNS
jgi:hypothetical protein